MKHKANSQGTVASSKHRLRFFLGIGISIFLISTLFYAYLVNSMRPTNGLPADIAADLEGEGYTIAPGFSQKFKPGVILQTMRQDSQGNEIQLPSAIVAMWEDQCFPGKTPRKNPYILAETSGSDSATLKLNGQHLGNFLPVLANDMSAVANYKVYFNNPQVETFSTSEINEQFSKDCVAYLAREIEFGKKPDWFSAVAEVIIADSIKIEINWKSGANLNTRINLKKAVSDTISDTAAANGRGESGTLELSLGIDNDKTTVISANIPVIVAYRAFPLAPVVQQSHSKSNN